MERTDNPEVLAVVPLPSAAERRRREVMLARVMLLEVDLVPVRILPSPSGRIGYSVV